MLVGEEKSPKRVNVHNRYQKVGENSGKGRHITL